MTFPNFNASESTWYVEFCVVWSEMRRHWKHYMKHKLKYNSIFNLEGPFPRYKSPHNCT